MQSSAPPAAAAPALTEATIEELFLRSGALHGGHFQLTSGRHSARYLEKFQVLQYPSLGVEIGRRLAEALAAYEPTLVVGPTTGGVLLSFETARQLSDMLRREVRGIFAERVDTDPGQRGGPRRALRRGWRVAPDERIVLVDDILTTGASVLETAEAVRAAGAQPLAAAVIVDRSTEPVTAGFPIHPLGSIEIESWSLESCPLCRQGVPINKPGSSQP
jgi:orotate phosphoribosyltransferase